MPLVEITKGKGLGRQSPVADDPVVIGRDAGCDIPLADSLASRRHAEIRRHGEDDFRIRDLGSSNGTFVNGRRIDADTTLTDNAEIRIGNIVMHFVLRGTAPQPPDPDAEFPDAETIVQTMETQSLPLLEDEAERDRAMAGATGAAGDRR